MEQVIGAARILGQALTTLIRGIVVDQGVVCASITEATQLLPGMQDVRVPLGPRGPAVQPSHDKGLITIPLPVADGYASDANINTP